VPRKLATHLLAEHKRYKKVSRVETVASDQFSALAVAYNSIQEASVIENMNNEIEKIID